jgi:hypothetical protein
MVSHCDGTGLNSPNPSDRGRGNRSLARGARNPSYHSRGDRRIGKTNAGRGGEFPPSGDRTRRHVQQRDAYRCRGYGRSRAGLGPQLSGQPTAGAFPTPHCRIEGAGSRRNRFLPVRRRNLSRRIGARAQQPKMGCRCGRRGRRSSGWRLGITRFERLTLRSRSYSAPDDHRHPYHLGG